jgi:lipoprotein NlpD
MSSGRSIPAPVEDKRYPSTNAAINKVKPATLPSKTSVANVPSENVQRQSYYTVKQGDTLIKIGLDQGQNWRDIMKWNAIENPNLIEVGQVLRIAPLSESVTDEVVVKPVTPLGNVSSSSNEIKNSVASPTSPSPPTAEVLDETLVFSWPVQGNVVATFDDSKNKGVDIAGKLGEAVHASADGKVVYAGAGLRGYGNLVILKHNNTFLTAYAHNQSLTVREDQTVKRGQKIAEMGNSDADTVKLHFEIRKMGKPVDPLKLLPPR